MKHILLLASMMLCFVGLAHAGDTSITVKATVNCGVIKKGCRTNSGKRKKMRDDARKNAKKACKGSKKKFKGGSLHRKRSTCKFKWKGNKSGNGGNYHLTCDYDAKCK